MKSKNKITELAAVEENVEKGFLTWETNHSNTEKIVPMDAAFL